MEAQSKLEQDTAKKEAKAEAKAEAEMKKKMASQVRCFAWTFLLSLYIRGEPFRAYVY